LRPSVDDGRYCIVVDLRLLAREAFGEGDAFLFGLVREHWAADNISDRVNTGNVRRKAVIHDDAALLVQCHTDRVEAETLRVGTSPDRHQYRIRRERLPFRALDLQAQAALCFAESHHFGAELELNPRSGERALQSLAEITIHVRHDVVEEFNDGDFGAEPPPH